jgi:hypothetical protein
MTDERTKIKAFRNKARSAVRAAIVKGSLPHANTVPCHDCGCMWAEGQRRHEYDHYKGYERENRLEVQPVCKRCHTLRDNQFVNLTHCLKGHPFDEANTRVQGTLRRCRACAVISNMAYKKRNPEKVAAYYRRKMLRLAEQESPLTQLEQAA